MQNLGTNIAGIVAFLVLARLISPREMGIWAVLQLIVAACSTFVTWFPQSVTKFVAENSSRGSRAAASAAFYQALRANLITYLPMILGLYFGAPVLASHLFGDISYAPLIRVLAFDVFLNAGALQVLVAALLGLGMFRETAFAGLVTGGIFRQILILALIVLMRNFIGLVIGWLISDAILVLIYLFLVVRVLGTPRFDFPLMKLFRFYLPLELAQIVSFAQNWFDRALLVLFVPLGTLGVYNVALAAYGVVGNVSISMSSMLFPALTSIDESKGRNALRDAIRTGTRYPCLMVTPLDFILFATAMPALALFVGQSYVGGFMPLMIFCAADAFTLFATVLYPALMAIEETAVVGEIRALTAVVGMVTAYLLLPAWGIAGASVGRACAIVLTAILQFFAVKRKISLRLDFQLIIKTLIAGTTAAAVVVAVQLLKYSEFMLPVYVTVGAAVYLMMLRLLRAVDANDFDLLRKFLGKRLALIANLLESLLLPSNPRERDINECGKDASVVDYS